MTPNKPNKVERKSRSTELVAVSRRRTKDKVAELNKIIDTMVRDFTEVAPRAKSEVRRRLEELYSLSYDSGRSSALEEVREIVAYCAHCYNGCPVCGLGEIQIKNSSTTSGIGSDQCRSHEWRMVETGYDTWPHFPGSIRQVFRCERCRESYTRFV